jgi:hypothetical protein
VRAGRPNNSKRGQWLKNSKRGCGGQKNQSARTPRQPIKSTEARALEKKSTKAVTSGPYLFTHSTHRVPLFLNVQHVLLSPSRAAFKPGSSRTSLSFSLLPSRTHMFLIFSLMQKRLMVMEQKASAWLRGLLLRVCGPTRSVSVLSASAGACAHRDSGGGDTTAEAVAAPCWTSWRRRRGEAARHMQADFGMR